MSGAAERADADAPTGWYVYGVVPAAADAEPQPADADREHPIVTLVEGEIAAVARQVPLAEFGEEPLREHLSDIGWVEAVARAHQAVLDQLVMARTTVLPMRMCTVYRTETGVRDWLRREAIALQDAIAELDHKSEWGVKVFVEPGDRTEAPTGRSDLEHKDARAQPSPGTAYIRRLRAARDERAQAQSLVQQAVQDIHQRLRLLSADALVIPPHRPEVSGHSGEMVLNGVYLVPDDTSAYFHAAIDELRTTYGSTTIELETTGPWPAYNFVPAKIGASS